MASFQEEVRQELELVSQLAGQLQTRPTARLEQLLERGEGLHVEVPELEQLRVVRELWGLALVELGSLPPSVLPLPFSLVSFALPPHHFSPSLLTLSPSIPPHLLLHFCPFHLPSFLCRPSPHTSLPLRSRLPNHPSDIPP